MDDDKFDHARERAREEYAEARNRVKSSEQWAWWKGLSSTQRFFIAAGAIIVIAIIIGLIAQ